MLQKYDIEASINSSHRIIPFSPCTPTNSVNLLTSSDLAMNPDFQYLVGVCWTFCEVEKTGRRISPSSDRYQINADVRTNTTKPTARPNLAPVRNAFDAAGTVLVALEALEVAVG